MASSTSREHVDTLVAIPERVCRTCLRVLDGARATPDAPVDYRHTPLDEPEDGHTPDPAPREEVPGALLRCDFCLSGSASLVLPVRHFEASPGSISNPDWIACARCAQMAQRNEWNRLVQRGVGAWEQRHHKAAGPDVVEAITRLYRLVRKNVTGSPRPI